MTHLGNSILDMTPKSQATKASETASNEKASAR